MNPFTETLALMAGGCVIRHGPHGWNVGGQPISEEVVYALLRRDWACATRTVDGDLTGRVVITDMGKRALRLMRKAA